ncbi:hypothetical protein PUN28_003483 [Cardiocondyla obscurior]|uniref:Secreted protein n=1 Tax=Cardiocondyla obscurior TaxID=286306 RepID=A0AAW2GNX9_9HYME
MRQTGEVIHTISLVVWHRVAVDRRSEKTERTGRIPRGNKRRKTIFIVGKRKQSKRDQSRERRWKDRTWTGVLRSFEKRGSHRKSYKQSQKHCQPRPNYPRSRVKRINGE